MLRASLRPWIERGLVGPPPDHMLTLRPEQLEPKDFLTLTRALFGDDFGADEKLLERGHVSKAWRAHKAGWKD